MVEIIVAGCFRKFAIVLVALFVMCMHGQGQLSRPGEPLPLNYTGAGKLIVYELQIPWEEKNRLLNREEPSLLKPAGKGLLIDTDFSPENSGTWDTLGDGTKVWRAAFHIAGAAAVNLIFNPYHLNKGVKIFLYDPGQQHKLGAFTDLNNKPRLMLATAHIPGETLILEMQVPRYANDAGSLRVAQVGCDFSDFHTGKPFKDGWYGLSAECNADINCFDDPSYRLVKNAVVRIVYHGGERCSGTLVNNTKQDGKNYVLTAEHCISKELDANTAVFYFDYESPYCDGPDGSSGKSISGATIRSTGDMLDFTLLELLEPVPVTYRPYYSGWDRSGNSPLSGYSIHHPLGDVKKISMESHAISVGNFGTLYNDFTHWLVRHWETGTTEAGSSGAGLFNENNRLVGSLTGGEANCENPVNDYYQMISHAWEDFSPQDRQLRHWLDPLDHQSSVLDGYDPYEDFWKSGDTLSNILPGEMTGSESANLTWGSLSGHNSDNLDKFAEKFTIDGQKKILGLILHVADNFVGSEQSKLVVSIWNGVGIPAGALYEKEVSLIELVENEYNFIEFDSAVSVGDIFFAGYNLFYVIPQDTFSTHMAENRLVQPVNTAFIHNNETWMPVDQYTGGLVSTSFGIMPVVFDSLPDEDPYGNFQEDAIVYPNPASDEVWIEFKEMLASPVILEFYDLRGQLVLIKEYGSYQQQIRLSPLHLGAGMYIIRVQRGSRHSELKIIVLK